MKTLSEIFAEEEAIREAKERELIAKEDAAYKALPQSEKDRIDAEREAKIGDFWRESEDGHEAEDDDENEDTP